jgi:paraquat-inducible protein B
MSRKANPTVIGAFVVGAIVISVAAVMILTSGQLFQKKLSFVMHFEGSVKGLTVGAPVSYRGVQVGTVKNIEIVLTPEQNARIPVTVEIDPAAFTLIGYDRKMSLEEFREGIYDSCKNEGLRAQLQMQSMLTGQLFIQLDYFKGTPARFVETSETPEIPTIPTTLQELGGVLQDFPIKKVLDDVAKAVAALADLAADEKIRTTIESVDQAFKDISKLAADLDSRTRPLEPALVEARQMLAEGRQTLAQATTTLAAAEQTFVKATETLAPMKSLVADDSELLESVDEALAAMTDAAAAIGALADTLERRPEAILRGKGVFGGD